MLLYLLYFADLDEALRVLNDNLKGINDTQLDTVEELDDVKQQVDQLPISKRHIVTKICQYRSARVLPLELVFRIKVRVNLHV